MSSTDASSTAAVTTDVAAADDAAGQGLDLDEAYQARTLGGLFWVSVAWLGLLVLAAVCADLLPLKDPNATFAGASRAGPSSAHWFGGDNIGHDVFSRTIYGARRSLAVATVATVVGLAAGGVLGLVAGYYRRALDRAVVALLDILLAVPGLVLALALVAFFAPPGASSPTTQIAWVTVALALLAVPTIARVVRAQTLVWASLDFVVAARTVGARNLRIMVREVLPNVLPAMFSFALLGVAVLIIIEAALALFGVGDVTGVSWGIMIQNGRSQLDDAPHMVLFPSLFMFFTILALNFVGDQVRRRFDVREGGI